MGKAKKNDKQIFKEGGRVRRETLMTFIHIHLVVRMTHY